MLPDIGGTELLVIAAVALIVVGPKDLPVLLRKLGQFVARIRGMANEFRASFDEMARQSELDELRKEVQAMREGQYTAPMRDAAAEAGHVDQVFADIDASLNSGAVQVSPHAAYQAADPTIHLPEPTVEIVSKPARKPRAAKPAPAPAVEIVSKPKRAVAKADKTDLSVPAKSTRKRAPKSDIAS
jgi:sec-independent protein translocase protein TatB